MSGRRKNSKRRQEKKPLSHGWIVLPSKSYPDRVYFYNTVTKCSTWNNPCEVTSDEESSSETSSSRGKRLVKSNLKSFQTSHPKKQSSKACPNSPDRNSNIPINTEIEDFSEEQDQYFDKIPFNALSSSLSNVISPSSTPDSSRANLSDSEEPSDFNTLLESNKEQLWVHFASNFDNPSAKKSIALSDFTEPSTYKMETPPGSSRRKSILKDFSEENEIKICNENPKKITIKSNKRKNRKIKKEQQQKKLLSKNIKSVTFNTVDTTPAQTRLLKLKKQNAERLKKLATKNPDFFNINKKSVDINGKPKNSNNLSLEKQTENDSFSDAYFKRIEICNNAAQELENHSEVDFSEEMDWEPSSEESDVKNINTFREQANKANEFSSDIFFGLNSDHSFVLPMKTYSWFLVLDTNVFVSCLSFVKELRDIKIPDLGYPVIYVPWRVLQELDHLKDTKIDAVDRNLHINVRKAIAFLNENFKSRHPRIFGQSFEEFANMVDVETSAPDDEILQTCIQFQKQHTGKKLMLLTNDKNLESKAIVSGVEVYSKERFCKKYLTSKADSLVCSDNLNTLANGAVKIADYICEVQAILKDFLHLFVETEMKMAFDSDWIKVAFKKPPWTFEDIMQCLLKHWRSVFFLNFTKETHFEVEKLNEKLFKRVAGTIEEVVEIIKTAQQLILSIRRSLKKKMPYSDLIPSILSKLSDLVKACSPDHSPQTNSGVSTSLPSSAAINDSLFPPEAFSQNEESATDISKVKNLFKDIWDSLRSFCCSVSDVVNSPEARNNLIMQEMKIKLSQILKEVDVLVLIVEKIFALNVSDINEGHPLIIYFSNFLIHVYPAMAPDLINELPKCLAAFFSDFEVRFLLTNSLKDFKDFIQDLSQAAEYFNTHFAC